ncbi:MAG: hypothetical protein ABI586_11890, partial [Candidatus Nanopelagicales bacterium]
MRVIASLARSPDARSKRRTVAALARAVGTAPGYGPARHRSWHGLWIIYNRGVTAKEQNLASEALWQSPRDNLRSADTDRYVEALRDVGGPTP